MVKSNKILTISIAAYQVEETLADTLESLSKDKTHASNCVETHISLLSEATETLYGINIATFIIISPLFRLFVDRTQFR